MADIYFLKAVHRDNQSKLIRTPLKNAGYKVVEDCVLLKEGELKDAKEDDQKKELILTVYERLMSYLNDVPKDSFVILLYEINLCYSGEDI